MKIPANVPAIVGDTLLRVALGIMFLAHSVVLKYFTFTLAGTAQYFASIGLPAALAYAVFAAEAVGGVLLVLGLYTRWVALALVPVLLGALWVHAGNGWVFNAPNGGWEYPLFLIVISVAVALQATVPGARLLAAGTDRTLRAASRGSE
jgi:putative oxidoreductase